ncbi:MAG: thioredoxin TrxC [Limnobacter sp.]|jgi:thioredoxin 2|uniref:thioredoxin TrxC n=1 Tax=Limnobacter sp. TaxID=2003368 RepID=UPI004037C976
MHLVCPACGAVNRVPPERLSDKPVCGRCQNEVAPTKPVALNDSTLPRYLERTEAPVLVDFWADWCGPCKVYGPQFEKLANLRGDIRFVKVDSDQAQQASHRYQVRSIPTTILFKHGKEIARVSGALSSSQLEQWLDNHLKT